jgi:hypothetical protein
MKIKPLVLGAVLLIGTTAAMAYPGSIDAITLQESLQTQLIPPAMKTTSQAQAVRNHYGIDLTSASNESAGINLSITGKEVEGALVHLNGHGALHVGSVSYPITIHSNQELKKSTLSNQHQVYYGLVEATVKDRSGDAALNLGVLYDADTHEAQVTAVAGDMQLGFAPLFFGEPLKDISPEEIRELMQK